MDALLRADDVANVLIAPAQINVVEGGSADFGLTLSSQPSEPVTVSSNGAQNSAAAELSDSAAAPQAVDGQQVTFDASNWDQPQRMTVQIPENDRADGVQEQRVILAVSSSDANFQNIEVAPVTVVVVDNDAAGVVLSSTHLNLSEDGGAESYQISLTSQPAADLTITLVTGDQVIANPTQITFTPANWQQAQSVTVSAVDDTQVELNGHTGLIRHTVASADASYNGITISNVGAAIEDNDTVGMTASDADNLQVSEGGGSVIYTLRLNARPGTDVVVYLSGGVQLTLEPASLTFTAENWNQTQAVSVKALDDAIDEGGPHVGLVSYHLSGDPAYAGLPVSEQLVTISDNDVAALNLSTTAIEVSRVGMGSYEVVLTSQPLEAVLIDLLPAGGAQLAMPTCNGDEEQGSCLIFDADNWNQPQVVSVQAYAHGQVSHNVVSGDDGYNGVSAPAVEVTLIDGGSTIFLPVISNR